MSPFDRITEQSSLYDNLEEKSTQQLLYEINHEDQKVALAVEAVLPHIAAFVDAAHLRLQQGGRIFYVGAGTSGRLGVLDASEIPPTFGMPPTLFVGLIAGGDRALRHPVENAEDSLQAASSDLAAHHFSALDSLVGIAASGTTPYVLAALRYAHGLRALTACITSNPGSPITQCADYPIVTVVGPEYVTGSSRMKSGTAQKMVLNMISTTLMIKQGRVQGNAMVNMQLTNDKLLDRGARIISQRTGLSYDDAMQQLKQAGSVRTVLDNFPL